ncbi:Uncharacterised protein [Mycobacterium tuberculosis]|nr:Uncharacterised protein [Mycobacterium tuberculosis]
MSVQSSGWWAWVSAEISSSVVTNQSFGLIPQVVQLINLTLVPQSQLPQGLILVTQACASEK